MAEMGARKSVAVSMIERSRHWPLNGIDSAPAYYAPIGGRDFRYRAHVCRGSSGRFGRWRITRMGLAAPSGRRNLLKIAAMPDTRNRGCYNAHFALRGSSSGW